MAALNSYFVLTVIAAWNSYPVMIMDLIEILCDHALMHANMQNNDLLILKSIFHSRPIKQPSNSNKQCKTGSINM